MLFPKIKRSRNGEMDYQWRSSRTGFRFGSNSFWRWLRYPFSEAAWIIRAQHRNRRNAVKKAEDK